MTYSLVSLDDGHILYFTMLEDFDFSVDMPKYLQECYELLENGPDRVIIITDARDLKPKSFDYIVQGANSTRSPEAHRNAEHSKVLKNFSIVSSRMAQLAVKGLNSASFGFFEVTIFETPDDALSQARQLLFGQTVAR